MFRKTISIVLAATASLFSINAATAIKYKQQTKNYIQIQNRRMRRKSKGGGHGTGFIKKHWYGHPSFV